MKSKQIKIIGMKSMRIKVIQGKCIKMKSIRMKCILTKIIRAKSIPMYSIRIENSIEWKPAFKCLFNKILLKIHLTKQKGSMMG